MAEQRDFYEILGVPRDADADVIKKSYRKLAMQYHPDRNPGNQEAEQKFREAAEAYDILSNPERRSQYDRFGHQAFRQGGGGFSNSEDIFSNFGDIFGDLFGMGGQSSSRGRRQSGPRRGSDLRYLAEIHLEDVLSGTEKEISFEAEESCSSCHGIGAEAGSKPVTCQSCGGTGQVVTRQGFFTMATTCPQCRGQGTRVDKPCKPCRGSGRQMTQRKIRLNIPAGVDTGTRLRVASEGEGGYQGGPPGDLFVEIRVREHDVFERDGDDIYAEIEIPYIQMILGAEVDLKTLQGSKTIDIPKGFQPGELLKVSGQGLPSLRGSRRGDLYYKIQVQMPEKVSKEEEKLLREIAELKGIKVKGEKSGLFGKK